MSTVFFPFLKGSGIGEKYPTILLAQDWKDNHPEDIVVLDSRQLPKNKEGELYKYKFPGIDEYYDGLNYGDPYWIKYDKIIDAHYLQKSEKEGDHSILGVEVPKEYSAKYPEKFIKYDHIANLAKIINSGKRMKIEILDSNAKKLLDEKFIPQLIKEKACLIQYRMSTALNGMERNTIKDQTKYIDEVNKLVIDLLNVGYTVYTTGMKLKGHPKIKHVDDKDVFGFIPDREDSTGQLMLKLYMLSKIPLVIGAASGYSLMISFLRSPSLFPVLFGYCDIEQYVRGALLERRFPGYLVNGGGKEGDLAFQGNPIAERFMLDVPQDHIHIMKFIKEFEDLQMIKY
jgi:hypothetical protein